MKLLGMAFLLLISVCGTAQAQFTVDETKDLITISYQGDPSWKAIVDRKHGGTIGHFSLGADGSNLVATKYADGLEHSFRGMFSAFYMTRLPSANPKERSKAKGTLWGRSNDTARLKVLSRGDREVKVETRGTGFGWRLVGPASEPVVEYSQVYTFLPDRIQSAGEIKWVYGHNLKMECTQFEHFLDSDQIKYPVHITDSSKRELELPITGSGGAKLPAEVAFPFTMLIDLKNKYRLEFRPLEVSPVVRKSRWYALERPWQQEWAQMVLFEGDIEEAKEEFPTGQPVPYAHEMHITRTPATNLPVPTIAITSPKRDTTHKLGDKVHFAARAVDSNGKGLPIEWEVFPYPGTLKRNTKLSSNSFELAIPAKAEDFDNRDIFWAAATTVDASGRKSQTYTSIDIDLPKPPVAKKPVK